MPTKARLSLLPYVGVLAAFVIIGAIAAVVALPHGGGGSRIGGPFTLVSQDGVPVTQRALEGHPTLVFFGYTHCPNVCPATLSQITAVFKTLDAGADGQDGRKDGRRARALFITVDPERDTPVVLKDYMSSFDPRITGLTGTPDQVEGVEHAYKATAKAVPDADGTYTMDHTAVTYLMDRAGTFVGPFDLDRPASEAAAELRRYF